MRIPNKFNGYMSDGRRLYPDPATSIIFAKALATAGGTAATVAPTIAATVAPTLATAATTAAVPLATTTAANLGTTAALEASKQGIIQAGAQQAGVEAAKQAGIEATKQAAAQGAQQAGTETLKQGIMQGADDAAAMNLNQVNALNPTQPLNASNYSASIDPSGARTLSDAGSLQGGTPNILPQKVNPSMDQLVNELAKAQTPPPSVANPTYNLTSKATPDFLANAPSPTNADLIGQGINTNPASYNVADAAKTIPKDVVGNPSLKMPGMEPLTTAKPPPNALERGFNAATKFASDHPYITAGGIMLAQNMSQPSAPAKKKYSRSGESNFKYTEPSTGEYTPIFEPTDYAKEGGLMGYAVGGPVETMSAQNAIGGNMMYPQSQLHTPMYSNPMTSRPMPNNVINSGIDAPTNAYSGEPRYAEGGNVTGSGNLNLNVPLNFGGPGIGGANGYATAGTGTGAGASSTPGYTPAPTTQIDASAAPAAATTQNALANAGRAFIPKMQNVGSGMFSQYTVNDQAADDWVKGKIRERGLQKAGGGAWGAKEADYQEFYNQYYRGYAKGGSVNAFEKMMQEDETRRKREAAQAKSDLDQEARSLAGRTKPYSRTQSTNSPYAAAVKELQGLGKKYGIQMAAPTKTNVDLMGDQDQIEYAANGGIMHGLGGYSDGGRLLKGPGDGVSDSIPAVIGNKQPARLADGEFVIPARIVSELGNGSTEAGARKLYAMMERIQKQRGKTVGKGKVAVNSKASKHLPA